jgi:hypothetical protein
MRESNSFNLDHQFTVAGSGVQSMGLETPQLDNELHVPKGKDLFAGFSSMTLY